jgi:3-oxoacyl-[acyl-carrier-protein] synthase III
MIVEAVGVVRGRRWGRRARSARRLADAAAEQAIERAGLVADDIDLLLNAGIYRDGNLGEPALAALIQEDIGAHPEDPHDGDHGTFSFDVANGSCGMLTGLQIADGFIRAGTIDHALVVASDADPGRHMAADFPFAPAGAAIVCGRSAGPEGITGFRFAHGPPVTSPAAQPEAGDEPAAPTGPAALAGPDDGLRGTVAFERGRNRLTIARAPGFEAAAGAWAGEVATALLADHDMTVDDVDTFVANPLTPAFLDALAHALGVDRERVGSAVEGLPVHTAGLGVALDAATDGTALDGRWALLVSAGAGPTAGAALVRTGRS